VAHTRSQEESAAAPAAMATDLDRERLRQLGYVE
jgi:hypothetical protein